MKFKIIKLVAFLAFSVFFMTGSANAVNCGTGSGTCFAIATGNWNAGATWSDTSGGASCSATCTSGPATGDAVTLDSGTDTKTVTLNVAASQSTFVSTCSTCTLTHNAVTLTITGNTFTLSSGMTYNTGSSSRIVSFTSTSGTTLITSAGKSFGSITFNGAGGTFQLQDALNYLNGGTLTLTAGTLNGNNQNVTGGLFVSSNSNTRVITPGSGVWTLNGTGGSPWDTSTSTNLTISANTATLNFTPSGTPTARLFATGGVNLNGWAVAVSTSGTTPSQFSFTGAGRMGSLALTAPLRVIFGAGVTLTIDSAFTWAGTNSANALNLSTADTNGTAATISVATGSPTINWASIQGLTFTGGATFTANNSFDFKGNTGITINGPTGGSGGRIIGG